MVVWMYNLAEYVIRNKQPVEMWCLARFRQYSDAGEWDGDGDLALVELVARAEHLLTVAA